MLCCCTSFRPPVLDALLAEHMKQVLASTAYVQQLADPALPLVPAQDMAMH
jgi:hypothetical protein